jgi:Bacterial extracellular solute-binding protein
VRELILPWGNPYYTKLALAAVGGSPRDVAVMHATRIPAYAPAGLLDGDELKPLDGPDALLDAFSAVKEQTGKTGVVFETRGVTPWRLFLTLYSQLGGAPIIEEGGSRIGMEDDKAIRALEWIDEISKRGVGGPDADYQASVALFGNQTAAFAFNGEWEVTTYQASKLPFSMRTIPTIFDGPATQADSHTVVIPRDATMLCPPPRTAAAARARAPAAGRRRRPPARCSARSAPGAGRSARSRPCGPRRSRRRRGGAARGSRSPCPDAPTPGRAAASPGNGLPFAPLRGRLARVEVRTYGQYCPVARATEILAMRWTPIIVRNLLLGCETFGELMDGAPGISRTLLRGGSSCSSATGWWSAAAGATG